MKLVPNPVFTISIGIVAILGVTAVVLVQPEGIGLTALALTAMLAGCSLLFGRRRVGRPLNLLAEQARPVGGGDLSAKVSLRRRDELAEISQDLNRMSERLLEARARVEAEYFGGFHSVAKEDPNATARSIG